MTSRDGPPNHSAFLLATNAFLFKFYIPIGCCNISFKLHDPHETIKIRFFFAPPYHDSYKAAHNRDTARACIMKNASESECDNDIITEMIHFIQYTYKLLRNSYNLQLIISDKMIISLLFYQFSGFSFLLFILFFFQFLSLYILINNYVRILCCVKKKSMG